MDCGKSWQHYTLARSLEEGGDFWKIPTSRNGRETWGTHVSI